MRKMAFVAGLFLASPAMAQTVYIDRNTNARPDWRVDPSTGLAAPVGTATDPIYTSSSGGTSGSTVAAQGSVTSGQTGTLNMGAVVSGDQTYTSGTTQPLNLTATGRLKVGVGAATGINPATQLATTVSSDLVACKNYTSRATWSDGFTGSIQCDTQGNLYVNNATLPPGAATDTTTNSLFKAGQSIGNTTFASTQSGTWTVNNNASVTTTAPTYTTGTQNALSLTTGGALRVDAVGAGGSTAANQSTQITAEQAIQANQTNATQKTQVANSAGTAATIGNPGGTVLGLTENMLSVRGVPYYYNPPGNVLVIGNGDATGQFVVQRGGGALATGQVSVTTTATLIAAQRNYRQKITVSVGAANTCAFGNSGVTTTTGFPLQPTAGATLTLDTNAALYAICSATTTVSYIEQY